MKKLVFAVFAALFAAIPVAAALEVPAHTERFYVNDFAEILSQETKDRIVETSKKLDQETGAQIVVATVINLDGYDIETYANKMFRDWKLGDSEKNSGLLFLVSRDDRRLRIEVGYGLEGILPDGKAGRIRDEYITPSLKEDKWDEGISKGYDALYEIIDQNREEIGRGPTNEWDSEAWIGLTIILVVIFGLIALAIYAKKHPEKFKTGTSSSNDDNDHSWHSSDGSGSSGGGWSGGSGGSSGGGGASGGF